MEEKIKEILIEEMYKLANKNWCYAADEGKFEQKAKRKYEDTTVFKKQVDTAVKRILNVGVVVREEASDDNS